MNLCLFLWMLDIKHKKKDTSIVSEHFLRLWIIITYKQKARISGKVLFCLQQYAMYFRCQCLIDKKQTNISCLTHIHILVYIVMIDFDLFVNCMSWMHCVQTGTGRFILVADLEISPPTKFGLLFFRVMYFSWFRAVIFFGPQFEALQKVTW